ncbi:MAG: hypothetical protein COA36_13180 [Desulfotalea sp.]|nr:MAG: hypothetical protein COA36_13180 [Desulfotalea sp.]
MKNDNTLEISDEARAICDLVIRGAFTEALEVAINILDTCETIPSDVYRFKSIAESAIGDHAQAMKTLESSLGDFSNEADWYLAGEYCLELGKINEAIDYLTKAIDLSLAKSDTYFLEVCYIERAYAYVKIGDPEGASKDLVNLEQDASVSWLRGITPITKQNLQESLGKTGKKRKQKRGQNRI